MLPSQNCIDLVKQFEGCRLKAYQDQKGIWTIGYGCTGLGIGPETEWTQAQADYQLLTRLNAYSGQVSAACGMRVSQNQFDACCSLAYNIGVNAFRGSTLVRLINQRLYQEAATEFPKWDKIGSVTSQGLLNRRLAEQALFLTPTL